MPKERIVTGESIISIELAVGSAVFVLGVRLFSLIQATRGVPGAHSQVVKAMAGGDLQTVASEASGMRYRNPYGEVASALVEASLRDLEEKKRIDNITRASRLAGKRIIRRTQQGQAADLVALAVACGIVLFSGGALPTGPVFWSLSGATLVLLLSSVVARGALKASVLGSLEALKESLISRPGLPSISDGPVPCFWCSGPTKLGLYDVKSKTGRDMEEVEAAVCQSCGKFVGTIEIEPPSE